MTAAAVAGQSRSAGGAKRGIGKLRLSNILAVGQGIYYLITGVWPLLDIETFQMVTGPKRDRWLVKTVGVLISVIGGVLLLAGFRGDETEEMSLLAIGSAAGLAAIDGVYVARQRISPIYLLDAAAEVALIAAWFAAGRLSSEE